MVRGVAMMTRKHAQQCPQAAVVDAAPEIQGVQDGGCEVEGGQVRAGAERQRLHADGEHVHRQQVIALL